MSLVEKTRREREQRGWWGREREREEKERERREGGRVWLLRNSLSFLISLKE